MTEDIVRYTYEIITRSAVGHKKGVKPTYGLTPYLKEKLNWFIQTRQMKSTYVPARQRIHKRIHNPLVLNLI